MSERSISERLEFLESTTFSKAQLKRIEDMLDFIRLEPETVAQYVIWLEEDEQP